MVRLASNHERRPEHRRHRGSDRRSCARGSAYRADGRSGADGDRARRRRRRDQADDQRPPRQTARCGTPRRRASGTAPLFPAGRPRRRAVARVPDGRRFPHRCAAAPARVRASRRCARRACATTTSPANWAWRSTSACWPGALSLRQATGWFSPPSATAYCSSWGSTRLGWPCSGASFAMPVWIGANAAIISPARSGQPCSPG